MKNIIWLFLLFSCNEKMKNSLTGCYQSNEKFSNFIYKKEKKIYSITYQHKGDFNLESKSYDLFEVYSDPLEITVFDLLFKIKEKCPHLDIKLKAKELYINLGHYKAIDLAIKEAKKKLN